MSRVSAKRAQARKPQKARSVRAAPAGGDEACDSNDDEMLGMTLADLFKGKAGEQSDSDVELEAALDREIARTQRTTGKRQAKPSDKSQAPRKQAKPATHESPVSPQANDGDDDDAASPSPAPLALRPLPGALPADFLAELDDLQRKDASQRRAAKRVGSPLVELASAGGARAKRRRLGVYAHGPVTAVALDRLGRPGRSSAVAGFLADTRNGVVRGRAQALEAGRDKRQKRVLDEEKQIEAMFSDPEYMRILHKMTR